MRVCIVGGALQGTEATYLAREAGMVTVVVDSRQAAPALSLADEPHVLDVVQEPVAALRLFESCDAVIPANENMETLTFLGKLFRRTNVPLIHDFKAYEISSSKARSNRFLGTLGAPQPRPWPECGYPVAVKPSGERSGGSVSRVDWPSQMSGAISKARDRDGEYIIQEFLEGPNISMEVISDGKEPVVLIPAKVVTDENYDCKMVVSPLQERTFDLKNFEEMGKKIAYGMNLRGIMNIKAIVSHGIPNILSIGARLPSQTPSAVYQSSGLNIIRALTDIFVRGKSPSYVPAPERVCTYEHLIFDHGTLYSQGESASINNNGIGDWKYYGIGADSTRSSLTIRSTLKDGR